MPIPTTPRPPCLEQKEGGGCGSPLPPSPSPPLPIPLPLEFQSRRAWSGPTGTRVTSTGKLAVLLGKKSDEKHTGTAVAQDARERPQVGVFPARNGCLLVFSLSPRAVCEAFVARPAKRGKKKSGCLSAWRRRRQRRSFFQGKHEAKQYRCSWVPGVADVRRRYTRCRFRDNSRVPAEATSASWLSCRLVATKSVHETLL